MHAARPSALLVAMFVASALTSVGGCADERTSRKADAPATDQRAARRSNQQPPPGAERDIADADAATGRTARMEIGAEALEVDPSNAAAPLAPLYAALAARTASDDALHLSTPLHCAAQALAALGEDQKPSLRVRRFIASACGVFAADLDAVYLSTDAMAGADLADLAEGFAPALASRLSSITFSGAVNLGVGAAQVGPRFIIVVAKAKRLARLEPDDDGASFRLTLEVDAPPFVRLADASMLTANDSGTSVHCREVLGAQKGDTDASLTLACPPATTPRWLVAGVQPLNWLVGQPLGAVWLGDERPVYVRGLPDAPQTPAGFAQLVRRARAQARPPLGALTLAPPNAEVDKNAQALLALLERGVLPTDAELATVLKWWLSGAALASPSDMGFVGWAVARDNDAQGELWGTVFEFPDTKSVVLTRETDRLVVSSVLPVSKGVHGVVYATYASRDDDALLRRVEQQLETERRRHGGVWTLWTDGPEVLSEAKATFGDNAKKRSELVRLATRYGNAQTQWLVLEAAQVNLITVPDALAAAQNVKVAFFVTRGDNRDTGESGVQVWLAYRP